MKKLLLLCFLALLPLLLSAQAKVVIAEVSYESPAGGCSDGSCNGKFITLYNYGTTPVDISGWELSCSEWDFYAGGWVSGEGTTFTFPEGSVMSAYAKFVVVYRSSKEFRFSNLYPSERFGSRDKIFYQNILTPPRTEHFELLGLRKKDGTWQEDITYFDFPQILPGSPIRSVTRFNITKENGRIVYFPEDYVPNTLALSAFPGYMGLSENGTPVSIPNQTPQGTVVEVDMDIQDFPKVIIGKLHYGVYDGYIDHYNGKYFTIYNYGSAPVDLSGWKLERARWDSSIDSPTEYAAFFFPNGSVLQPHANFIVIYYNGVGALSSWISVNLSDYARVFEMLMPPLYETNFEELRLVRPDATVQDFVNYDDAIAALMPAGWVRNGYQSGEICLARKNVTVERGGISFVPEDYEINNWDLMMDEGYSWLTELHVEDEDDPGNSGGGTGDPGEGQVPDGESPQGLQKIIIAGASYSVYSGFTGSTNGKYITLYNYGYTPVDVSGWRLAISTNGSNFSSAYTLPAGSVMKPGARFVVVYRHTPGFTLSQLYPNEAFEDNDSLFYQSSLMPVYEGDARFETIYLLRKDGSAQDQMSYDDIAHVLDAAQPLKTIERTNVSVYNSTMLWSDEYDDFMLNSIPLSCYPNYHLEENHQPLLPPSLSFAYDESGNRTGRFIVLPAINPPYEPGGSPGMMMAAMAATVDSTPVGSAYYTDMLDRSDVIIYPNPTRGSLAVEVRNIPQGVQFRMVVRSMSGVPVFEQGSVGSYTTVDLTRYPQGLYTLRIASPSAYLEWRILKE